MANPVVRFETSAGSFSLELFADKSPLTVANFVQYVKDGFYDGTIFHRIIPGFMIQGGGMKSGMEQKTARPPIKNEADNGVNNARGTIAMARTSDPDSATCQFFVNLVDNKRLDFTAKDMRGWGYCALARSPTVWLRSTPSPRFRPARGRRMMMFPRPTWSSFPRKWQTDQAGRPPHHGTW